MTVFPYSPPLPAKYTAPDAGARTAVPRFALMSRPWWNSCSPVQGDVRMPNRELSGPRTGQRRGNDRRSEEHTSELQSHLNLVCRLLLEKKKKNRLKENTPPLYLVHIYRAHHRKD